MNAIRSGDIGLRPNFSFLGQSDDDRRGRGKRHRGVIAAGPPPRGRCSAERAAIPQNRPIVRVCRDVIDLWIRQSFRIRERPRRKQWSGWCNRFSSNIPNCLGGPRTKNPQGHRRVPADWTGQANRTRPTRSQNSRSHWRRCQTPCSARSGPQSHRSDRRSRSYPGTPNPSSGRSGRTRRRSDTTD